MTTMHEEIVSYLETVSNVTDLTGTDGIMPSPLVESQSLPAVTFKRISNPRITASLVKPRWQFECWAETIMAAEELAQKLRVALNGYTGDMGSTDTVSWVNNDIDAYDPLTTYFRIIVETRFLYREP